MSHPPAVRIRQRDRGAAEALGLVLFFPIMIGLAVLILFLGRQVDTNAQVRAASDAAAQAAALQRNPAAALSAARETASAMLADATACSGGASVSIDTSAWAPGGTVSVTVACSPRRDDLTPIGPPPRRFTATGSAVIDVYRSPALP